MLNANAVIAEFLEGPSPNKKPCTECKKSPLVMENACERQERQIDDDYRWYKPPIGPFHVKASQKRSRESKSSEQKG
jgi:hypothetical protein